MTELLALSVSVAVLGGIWAFIALGPLGGFALVWVGFIAAGCFFAAGGDIKALSKTIVGMIYGAIVAWIALLIIAKVPVPGLGTVWPAIVVGVTVFFLVIVSWLSCARKKLSGAGIPRPFHEARRIARQYRQATKAVARSLCLIALWVEEERI